MSEPVSYVPTTLQQALNWAQKYSLFTYPFATACCAMEFMSTMGPRYDIARFGAEFPRFSPRQADLLIVIGTITERQAPVLRRVYDQMADPKWVMAFGVCASTGGFYQNYTVTPGADQVIPVDIYVPGCPPRPEQVLDGLMALMNKIQGHRGEIQRAIGDTTFTSTTRDRRRLPIVGDGTSMRIEPDARLPRDGRVR
jgi:NADH-quinone oxidoreductase subunit B